MHILYGQRRGGGIRDSNGALGADAGCFHGDGVLAQGFPVQGEDGQPRPVEPEDIVILMRSPRARLAAYTAALRRENIPCTSGESEAFFSTLEAAVMVSFLQIIDNPRQDVPLIAVLRSPL